VFRLLPSKVDDGSGSTEALLPYRVDFENEPSTAGYTLDCIVETVVTALKIAAYGRGRLP
jgi:hypothetical protein